MDFLAGICGPQVEAAPALGAPLGVWLHDATPAEDKKNACSPALVNAKCSLEHGALEETFNGAATAWEIMAKSFEQYGERNALGASNKARPSSAVFEIQYSLQQLRSSVSAVCLDSECQLKQPRETLSIKNAQNIFLSGVKQWH